jgi:hypothetical protein
MKNYVIPRDEEKALLAEFNKRNDIEAQRIKNTYAMPDLSRTPGVPIHEIMKRVTTLPVLKDFDQSTFPKSFPRRFFLICSTLPLTILPEASPTRTISMTKMFSALTTR